MTPKPGDLVLVPFPFANLRAVKRRPALVLSTEAYNRSGSDLLVCAVTSNLQNTSHSVLLSGRDMETGVLPVESRIKADKIATLEKSIIVKTVGRVKPGILGQVLKEVLILFPAVET